MQGFLLCILVYMQAKPGRIETERALEPMSKLNDGQLKKMGLAREQLPAAEQAALAQLAAWGIVPQPANESRCLNYDCLSMENYEGVRLRQYRMTLEEQG